MRTCVCGHLEQYHWWDRWGYCLLGCDCVCFAAAALSEREAE
jgi:hypothetical protein